MIGRLAIVAALAGGLGIFSSLRSGLTGYEAPSEKWLEQQVPKELDGFEMIPSRENPEQTYKMNEETYEALKPFGIVSRHYEKGDSKFDAVVIAGDNADCFHDQRACFTSQGWKLNEDRSIMLETKTLGKTPAVLLDLEKEGFRTLSLFTFRGPSGQTYSSFQPLWGDFMKAELSTGKIQQGQFFRVIALSPATSEEELLSFASDLIDGTVGRLQEAK